MNNNFGVSSFVAALSLCFAGCGDGPASFKSVPGEAETRSADAAGDPAANGEAGDAEAANPVEDANANDTDATTVIVGGEGQPAESPDASIMNVSIDEGGAAGSKGTEGSDGTDSATASSTGNGTDTAGTTPPTDGQTPPPSTQTPPSENSTETVYDSSDKKSMADCADLSGTPVQKIKVVSSKNSGPIVVKADEILLIRATGNKPVVKISTENAEKAKVKGICIFAAGNQAKVEAVFGINVGTFSYFGTGNMSTGSVMIKEDVVVDQIRVRLRGNQAKLTVAGEGEYKCGAADLGGNKTQYICGNK